MGVIQKDILTTLRYIKDLYEGEVGDFEGCPAAVEEARLVEQERGVAIDCKASWREVWTRRPYDDMPEFSFCKENKRFVVPENVSFLSASNEFNTDEFQEASISINRFYSADIDWNQPHFLRSVQPLDRFDWVHTFHTWGYEERYPNGGWYSSLGLLEVNFKDKGIFHLYPYKFDNQYYLVCEAHFGCTVEEFNEYAFAAQLSLGFFTDRITLDEAYVLCYADALFTAPQGIYYMELRSSIKGQYPIFTTNMYWLHEILKSGKNNSYADAEVAPGGVVGNIVDWLQMDFYSRMVNEIYAHEELRRAACIILEASTVALEYQTALYAVALECLTSFLLKEQGNTSKAPVDKDTFNRIIRPAFQKILEDAETAGKIDQEALKILGNRLNNLNGVTNSGKLTDPFVNYGYPLSKTDKEAINTRNRLLHGGILNGVNYKEQFDKLYGCSLRLHKLCCILLLKRVGFNSCIINLPVLRDFAEECAAHEPVLIQL